MKTKLSHEEIKDFIESQIAVWPQAKKNLDALSKCRRRRFSVGDLNGCVQFNPERVISTGAKTDAVSVKERPCFLCQANRPKEQLLLEIEPGWDLLYNPFPIFPIHLTIVSRQHTPQVGPPIEMVSFAEKLEGMTIFFNGASAGASAPDHLHLQAVLTEELPLMRLVEERHAIERRGILDLEQLGLDLPFRVVSAVIFPDLEGMRDLSKMMEGATDGAMNCYCWIDGRGYLRIVRIERKAHRPSCYGWNDGQRLVSPGAIDMAGVMITPLEKDFVGISDKEIRRIYSETGK